MVRIRVSGLWPCGVVAMLVLCLAVSCVVTAQEQAIFRGVSVVESDISLQVDCEILREIVRVIYLIDGVYEGRWDVDKGMHSFVIPKVDTTEGVHRVYMEFVDMDNGETTSLELGYWCPTAAILEEVEYVPPDDRERWSEDRFTPDMTFMLFMAIGFAVVGLFIAPGIARRRTPLKRRFKHLSVVVEADRREKKDRLLLEQEQMWRTTLEAMPATESFDLEPVYPEMIYPEVIESDAQFSAVATELKMLSSDEIEVAKDDWTECPYCSEWNLSDQRRCGYCNGRLRRPRGGSS